MTDATYRVLVVDDYAALHEDIRKLLVPPQTDAAVAGLEAELFGRTPPAAAPRYRLDSAYQGAEALARVQSAVAEGQPYAVALVDVRMPPGWDGVETVARIWAEDADVQVVLCTAYADYAWADIVERFGATDSLLVLKKPFEPVELLQTASALSRKWWLQRHQRVLSRQLASSERLAGIGQLAAGVSHEVNSPLTYVLGNQAHLLERLEDLARHDRLFDQGADLAVLRASRDGIGGAEFVADLRQLALDIGEGADRIREIAADLRTLARASDDEPREVDVADAVRSALRITAPQVRGRAAVVTRFEGRPTVRGHAGRLSQVFVNLVVNAAQAMGDRPGSEIRVTCARAGDRVECRVADNGPGILPEQAARIFEPFYSTKGPVGTGLGLPISRDIARAHGGDLTVEATPGGGATFRLTLPAGDGG